MKTIGITGGSGLVGTHVASLLVSKGYGVIIFTRDVAGKIPPAGGRYAQMDAANKTIDVTAVAMLEAVIHLAGEPVAAKRWSAKQKSKIVSSRVEGTKFLVSMLQAHAPGCKALIAASAIGYYGPDTIPPVPFTETHLPYNDFLGETCRLWEAAIKEAATFLRTVILRTGIVFAPHAGAFSKFVKPTTFGLLPIPGNGKQVISWIHISDLAALYVFALEHNQLQGIYNATAPEPVTCDRLMAEISKSRGGFLVKAHVPAFLLRLILGEMSIEVLKSCTVSAAKTNDTGFRFAYPQISDAVKNLLKKQQ